MNNKGLTLVELITTFALASVIIILLINIIVVIKDVYTSSEIETDLYVNQSNLSTAINTKFIEKNLIATPTSCDNQTFCYDFSFDDGEIVRLKVDSNKITFGTYVYELKNGSSIGECSLSTEIIGVSSYDVNNNFLIIKIPITNKIFPNKNFGVNIVYPYHF